MNNVNGLIAEIFHEVFQCSVDKSDSIETIALWDSIGHMELMAAIEVKCGVRIEPEEIITLTSVSAIQKYLEEKS